jgi:hypothetical protein
MDTSKESVLVLGQPPILNFMHWIFLDNAMLDCIEKPNCLCCRAQITIHDALSALLGHFWGPQAFPPAGLGDKTIGIGPVQICYFPVPDQRRDGSLKLCRSAIERGMRRVRSGFKLSLRLLREMHKILLKSGRGASEQPGEFRRSQNWIGGTRPGNALSVPPPPNRLDECLSAFERFLHDPTSRRGTRALGERWRADRLA